MDAAQRAHLIAWYHRNRARTRRMFDVLAGGDAYYSQPIALRHPIVFYEGHPPAFSFNTLVKTSLRNWFRPHYSYVDATFRCARDIE